MIDNGVAWALGLVGSVVAVREGARALRGRPAEVGVSFGPDLTADQLRHVMAAQSELRQAGVSFDTGYSFPDGTRDWEWDWSLEGPVRVKHRRFRDR